MADLGQVGTALQSFRRPVGIMPVVRGHVRRNGDVASSPAASSMAGDTFMFVEDLDRLVGQARTDTAADQDVGNGVEGMIDLDMVVEVYFRAFPFGILKGGHPRLWLRPHILGPRRPEFGCTGLEDV